MKILKIKYSLFGINSIQTWKIYTNLVNSKGKIQHSGEILSKLEKFKQILKILKVKYSLFRTNSIQTWKILKIKYSLFQKNSIQTWKINLNK